MGNTPSRPPSSSPVGRIRGPLSSITPAEAYATSPPVIRERLQTVDLEDVDADYIRPVDRFFVSPLSLISPPSPPRMPERILAPVSGAVVRAVPPPPESEVVSTFGLGVASDPADIIFDSVYEMNFAETQWQAASLCASTLGVALGARAVVVHAHNLSTGKLHTIGTHGASTLELLGASELAHEDLVASVALHNEDAVTLRFDGELPQVAPHRMNVIGAPRTLIAVPALAWGECLALIEVFDPDEQFMDRVADSVRYVAQCLAEFLSERAAA